MLKSCDAPTLCFHFPLFGCRLPHPTHHSTPIRPHIRSTHPTLIHTTVIDERDMLPIIHYRVDVNFSLELRSLIREARYLERLGLPIPEVALNVALQEGGHYLNMERLKAMVETFREAISSLTPEQKAVLVDRIKHLGT
jgi:hypothetical protein